ncbi:MAG: hypothetical protein ABIP94_09790 [Planctomycetota bacterium]
MHAMHRFAAIARRAGALAAGLLVAGLAEGQSQWFLRGSAAEVRVAGAAEALLRGPRAGPVDLPDGDYAVHFASDAVGKPISLELSVPAGASVHIAVAAAPPVAARTLVPDGEGWQVFGGGGEANASWVVRCIGEDDARDYRVVAETRGKSDSVAFGVVARWLDENQHYRFVWDRRRDELRLERRLGPDTMVLAKAPSPPRDDRPHVLALQVAGFRLKAFCDEALVLQAFDGAMTEGCFGTWTIGEPPTWERLALEPTAAPRASSAIVRQPGRASFYAGTEVGDGHFHVLELSLDRPHPLVPITQSGLELWLLQRSAAPQVLLADWRNSLGPGVLGEVKGGALGVGELRWPALPWLLHEAALVRYLLVSPDGEVIVASTPWVPLVF